MQYFSLLSHLLEVYPETVAQLNSEAFSRVLATLDFGLHHQVDQWFKYQQEHNYSLYKIVYASTVVDHVQFSTSSWTNNYSLLTVNIIYMSGWGSRPGGKGISEI